MSKAARNTTRGTFGRALAGTLVRHSYLGAKAFSSRYVHPLLPSVHEAVFVKLKGVVRRQYLRRMSARADRGVRAGERLYRLQAAVAGEFAPLVSVIVPNYRHEDYLRRRLDSVYAQTYPNFEVILLDDASGDGSVAILQEYADRHPERTRCVFNSENSGGVFHQWSKGLALARGALVWIAESDDWCSDNFLAEVVPAFRNEALRLSYCRSVFVDGKSEQPIWSMEEFLAEIDPALWNQRFLTSAHALVNHAWAMKNVVPNVSSAVFRHPGKLPLLADASWQQMRICGDWVFYLHLIRGGLVAYTPDASNYYRIHGSNTSVATYARDVYYAEHERVARELVSLYRIDDALLPRQREILQQHWKSHRPNDAVEALDTLYDLDRIRSAAAARKPNLMMAGFALIAGGGETFPIKLANLMHAAGYAVTFFNCGHTATVPGVRAMLDSDIPLLELDALHLLEAAIEDMGIEVVHSHHAWVDTTLCALLEHRPDPALVISVHGMYEAMPAADFAEALPLLDARVDRLVYTTAKNLSAFDVPAFGENRIERIGNALEIYPVVPAERAPLGIDADDFVLCLVSRAIAEKGWAEAIEAVALANARSTRPIHLLLIGEGEEYDRLQPAVRDPHVHFLGFRADIRSFFAMADLGLLPTRFRGESFPLVLIDCLHSGRPMLASRVGEIEAMLATASGCAGTTFALDNWQIPVAELAELILRHAGDADYHRACTDRVAAAAASFDPARMQQSYADAYARAIEHSAIALAGGTPAPARRSESRP